MTADRTPRSDAQRNRLAVLAAAEEVFAASGPGASLNEVARRAGVGPGTLYRHFPAGARCWPHWSPTGSTASPSAAASCSPPRRPGTASPSGWRPSSTTPGRTRAWAARPCWRPPSTRRASTARPGSAPPPRS
nr:helix-turn-helix domain-containing protein [Kitasatospora cheerisanensis]